MKRLLPLLILALSATTFQAPALASSPFDRDMVMTDRDLTDTGVPDDFAQHFLESKRSGIAGMRFMDLDGSMKKPGELITYYGRIYGISPRYLLALIQKEQSLVTDASPSVCQIDWAAGYGRPDGSACDDPAWQKFRGFTNQIINAAAFARYFYDTPDRDFGYFPGRTASIDGEAVTPANIATAMLYTYTPHVHGNRLLTSIWAKWFVSSYPDGSYLRDGRGEVWLIQAGQKRRFASLSALYSRVDDSRVIEVSPDVLSRYEEGPVIKFADYSIVSIPSGRVYLLIRDVKRPITSMEVFRTLGYNPEEIEPVAEADIASYVEGDPITLESSYPTGALLQNDATGGVYWVIDGVKRPIWSREIMKINYPGKKIDPVSKAVLDRFPTGEPVRIRDGELVTCDGCQRAVYVISNGLRRPIISGKVFEALGYDWRRVIHTTDEAVFLHPLGELVTLTEDDFQITGGR